MHTSYFLDVPWPKILRAPLAMTVGGGDWALFGPERIVAMAAQFGIPSISLGAQDMTPKSTTGVIDPGNSVYLALGGFYAVSWSWERDELGRTTVTEMAPKQKPKSVWELMAQNCPREWDEEKMEPFIMVDGKHYPVHYGSMMLWYDEEVAPDLAVSSGRDAVLGSIIEAMRRARESEIQTLREIIGHMEKDLEQYREQDEDRRLIGTSQTDDEAMMRCYQARERGQKLEMDGTTYKWEYEHWIPIAGRRAPGGDLYREAPPLTDDAADALQMGQDGPF